MKTLKTMVAGLFLFAASLSEAGTFTLKGATAAPAAAATIPTLGEWGLITLALIAGLSGIYFLREKKMPMALTAICASSLILTAAML